MSKTKTAPEIELDCLNESLLILDTIDQQLELIKQMLDNCQKLSEVVSLLDYSSPNRSAT